MTPSAQRDAVDGRPRRPGGRGAAPWAEHAARCAEVILRMADSPAGVSAGQICAELKVAPSTAHIHLRRQVQAGTVHMRVGLGLTGRVTRYFADAAAADAWREDSDNRPARPAKPAPAKKPKPLPKVEIRERQPVVTLRPAPVGAMVDGECKITAETKYTIDTKQRPNSRIEAAPAPAPDPRWPRFGGFPPGINPETGRAWAQ